MPRPLAVLVLLAFVVAGLCAWRPPLPPPIVPMDRIFSAAIGFVVVLLAAAVCALFVCAVAGLFHRKEE